MLTQGDGTHELTWAPDGKTYVDTWSRVDLPPRHELRRASDGALLGPLEAALLQHGAVAGLRAFVAWWRHILIASSYLAGCPVLAVATEPFDGDREDATAAPLRRS